MTISDLQLIHAIANRRAGETIFEYLMRGTSYTHIDCADALQRALIAGFIEPSSSLLYPTLSAAGLALLKYRRKDDPQSGSESK